MTDVTQDKLIEYVLGECDETESRMIEKEISTSNTLQKLLADLNDSFASTGLVSEPLQTSPGLASRLFESIENQFSFAGFIDRLTVFLDLPKIKVQEFLAGIEDGEHHWKASKVTGLMQQTINTGPRHDGAECTMFRLEPGVSFPSHSHRGDEWGFILKGEAIEDNGQVHKPGDMVYKSADSRHSVLAGANETLLLIVIHRGISFSHS